MSDLPNAIEIDDLYERILAMGAPGTGKSYGMLKLFDYLARHLPNVGLFVIDADKAIRRTVLLEFPQLRTRVRVFPARTYDELLDAAKTVASLASPGDWVGVDMMAMPWESAQRHFIASVHETDVGKFMLEKRMGMEHDAKSLYLGGGLLKGWLDWPVINNMYKDVIYPLYAAPVHMYATTAVADIPEAKPGEADTSADIRAAYAPFGFRAVGQKMLGHQFQTLLWLRHVGTKDDWRLTTVKDRGRKSAWEKPLKDFAVEYLEEIANWKDGHSPFEEVDYAERVEPETADTSVASEAATS